MSKKNSSFSVSSRNTETVHNNTVFFTLELNGEVIRFELPIEEVKASIKVEPPTLKLNINIVDFKQPTMFCFEDEDDVQILSGQILRLYAEAWIACGFKISFYEMKGLMAKAYGACRHSKNLKACCRHLNAYNNQLVRFWLKHLKDEEYEVR